MIHTPTPLMTDDEALDIGFTWKLEFVTRETHGLFRRKRYSWLISHHHSPGLAIEAYMGMTVWARACRGRGLGPPRLTNLSRP